MFCLGVVLCECEWTSGMRETPLLQNWCGRGLFYAFVGLLAYDDKKVGGLEGGGLLAELVGLGAHYAALAQVACGALYFVMGLCCLRRLRDHKLARWRLALLHAEVQDALHDR